MKMPDKDGNPPAVSNTTPVDSGAPDAGPATPVPTPPAAQPVPDGDPTQMLQQQLEREKARRSGLDTLVSTRIEKLEANMTKMMQTMESLFSDPGEPTTPDQGTPDSGGKDPDPVVLTEDQEVAFMDQIQEMRSMYDLATRELQKDRMLLEMAQHPDYQNLGLHQFAEYIPTAENPEKQKEAIDAFATKLRSQTGSTTQRVEQAFARGATAGSSPGQGPGGGQQQRAAEIWGIVNDPAKQAELSDAEFQALTAEWDALPRQVQAAVSTGITQPWPDVSAVLDTLRTEMDEVQSQMQQFAKNPYGPGFKQP